MNKNEKNYMGKIEYWTEKLNDEVFNKRTPNMDIIEEIHAKIQFFIHKQFGRF